MTRAMIWPREGGGGGYGVIAPGTLRQVYLALNALFILLLCKARNLGLVNIFIYWYMSTI